MIGAATAVIALAIASVLIWKNRMPKTVALLTLVAGGGLAGGVAGDLLHQGLNWASDLVGQLTSEAFGVAVPAVLAVVALIIYVHDMWPKHRAGRDTAVVGLALPVLVTGMAGAAGSLANQAIDMVRSGASAAFTALFGT